MAPEILMRQAKPGADSDLFSLAVLIFRLLTRHDPLKGKLELAIRCLDEPARRRLYGEDPVFIFDPDDARNRPDPELHQAALVTWPLYPSDLQALFLQTFVAGLKAPSRRALTGQWQEVLARSLDRRQLCGVCGQETFGTQPACWHCHTPLAAPPLLHTPHAAVVVSAGNALHAHHFNKRELPALDRPLARIDPHPGDPALLGLRNLSDRSWRAELADGRMLTLDPGRSCNLAGLRRLETHLGSVSLSQPAAAATAGPLRESAP